MKRTDRVRSKAGIDPTQIRSDDQRTGTDRNLGKDHERRISRDIRVRGDVNASLPPEVVKTYIESSGNEDTRENKRLVIECVTLAAVIIVAALNIIEAYEIVQTAGAAREANLISRKNFINDQRPYVLFSDHTFNLREKGGKIEVDLGSSNYGKSPALRVIWKGYVGVGPNARQDAYAHLDLLGSDRFPGDGNGSLTTIPPSCQPMPRRRSSTLTCSLLAPISQNRSRCSLNGISMW